MLRHVGSPGRENQQLDEPAGKSEDAFDGTDTWGVVVWNQGTNSFGVFLWSKARSERSQLLYYCGNTGVFCLRRSQPSVARQDFGDRWVAETMAETAFVGEVKGKRQITF
ncbi:MAG: hypothetical protein SFX18_17520 [Pirellulales bacterium]|nr:hypothetical protein [Pirellulales bacterium]